MRYLGLLHKRRGRYVECRHVSAHAESVQAQERAELVALDVYRIAEKTGRPITSTGRPAGATAARRCGAATTRAGHCAAVAKARSGQVPVIAVLGLVGSAAWRPPRPPSQAKPSQARGEDHCRDDWCGPANGVTARGAMHCTVRRRWRGRTGERPLPLRPTSSSPRNTSTTPRTCRRHRRPAGPQASSGVLQANGGDRTGRHTLDRHG